MKHYYLLITCGQVLDTSARFYKVPIGTGKQDTRDFLTLTALSAERGYYFHLWDVSVDEFLLKCMDSVWGSSDPLTIANHLSLVPARVLVKTLRVGTSVPLSQTALDNAKRTMYYLNVNYRCSQGRRK